MVLSLQTSARIVLASVLIGTGAVAQAPVSISPRNANYRIDVELDVDERTLIGSQVVEWRNTADRATSELWFHLYWNAWRNDRSTWMIERGLVRPERKAEIEDWGWLEISSARLLGRGPRPAGAGFDLMSGMRFASPDDGNPNDRTVAVFDLPRPVDPGESVGVELHWKAKIPRAIARAGYRGDYYLIGHWFPQLGVFEGDRWNCHQFHAMTEFFADYGTYDVRLTVPEGYVVGATGREIASAASGEGKATHRYRAADVHGFAWTASPDFLVREKRFETAGLPPVEMRLLIQPEHQGQAERYFHATAATLELFGTWYGPYPYGYLTIVDPAWNSRSAGMEYPTLFVGGARKVSPARDDRPEGVTVHETGHQFWYGMVGNNEQEAAWLDEGLNSFSTSRALDTTYPPRLWVRRYLPLPGQRSSSNGAFAVGFPEIEVSRWSRYVDGLRSKGLLDAPAVPSYRQFPGSTRKISYNKTALWLATLERHLGWETTRKILATFHERQRFRHPGPEDLLAVADEVSGQDLGWFFDQVHRDSVEFDYGIESVASRPAAVEGWIERDGERVYAGPPADPESTVLYRTEVLVRRYGGGRFPVDVLLVFEDGHEVREPWDGQATWTLVSVERAAKLDYAVVDPDKVLMLDVNRINNSRHREPQSRLPARKWGSKWMIWLQDFLATFAFFA